MYGLYECSRCGVVARLSEQVCMPRRVNDRQDYCGSMPDRSAACDCIHEQIPIVCIRCGRPAEQAELVCRPGMLG